MNKQQIADMKWNEWKETEKVFQKSFNGPTMKTLEEDNLRAYQAWEAWKEAEFEASKEPPPSPSQHGGNQ